MSDEDLLEQATGLRPVYVDGFGAYRKTNGVLRCIGYVIDGGAQLSLIISLVGASLANAETKRVLEAAPPKAIQIWEGGRAH